MRLMRAAVKGLLRPSPALGDGVGRRCIGDVCLFGAIDAREPASAPTARRDELPCKGIVATGIENHDLYALRLANCVQNVVLAYCPVVEVELVLNFDVDRKKIVLSIMLETVTGVVKERGVGILCSSREFDKRLVELAFSNIGAEYDVKPHARQRLGQIMCIISGIDELRRDACILAIPDDESDALIRQRGPDPKGQYQRAQKPHRNG